MTPAQIRTAVQLYRKGHTVREIAARLDQEDTGSTVWRTIRHHVSPRQVGPRGRVDVTDEQVVELRDELRLSFKEIAEELGMSKSGVQIRYRTARGWRRDPATRQWIAPGQANRRPS